MKLISWNVNGLRACLKKGLEDVFNTLDADFFCIQETKMQPGQADFAPEGYTEYIYSADKKATPARPSGPGNRRCRYGTAWTRISTTTRAAPSRWNTRAFTS